MTVCPLAEEAVYILRLAQQPFNPSPQPPGSCPRCASRASVRWGQRHRLIKDRGWAQATVQRYRCKSCKRTFSARPQGLGRSPQTQSYQATLLALYLLGLSFRHVAQVLALLNVPQVSFVTVWRDLQRWGQPLRRPSLQARIVGVDTTFVRVRGKSQGILLAVALGGKTLLVQAVGSPKEYQRAFATLRRLGAEVVVSDDDQHFVQPLEQLALQRQGCVWHAARALGRAVHQLSPAEQEPWQEVISLLRESLKTLPPRPPEALFRAQTLPLPDPLRWAVVYLLNLWNRLTLYQRKPGLPRTNNLSEQAIGRSKFRARTVRGFKSLPGALNFFAATQHLLAAA